MGKIKYAQIHLFETKIHHNFLQEYFEKKYQESFSQDYFKYFDTQNYLLFPRESFLYVQDLFKKIDTIFIQAYNFYTQDIERNLPEEYHIFIPYFKKRFLKKDYLIGRYDVLIERETQELKIIEFNANTPGMITDIKDISSLLRPKNTHNFNGVFQRHIKKIFQKFQGEKIGILLPYSHADEDFLVGLDYQDILSNIIERENIILGDIFESNIIENNFYLKGEKIDILINFFPLEFFLTDREYASDFLNIIQSNHLKILNNLESLILQDKLLFAIIWENIEKYSQELQEIITKHIPFTSRVKTHQSSIIKQRFGRLSQGVYQEDFNIPLHQKSNFIYQETIYSQNIDDENHFLILGVFSNLKKILSIISRRQNTLITNDESVKIMACYREK